MQDPTSEVLAPDQPFKLSSGEEITVRELSWKDAKRFLTTLAGRAAEFIKVGTDGQTQVDTGKLMGVVVTDLGETLVMACTGLDQAAADQLSCGDMMQCIDRAVALNLRPEMIEAGKAIAGRFKTLVKKP